MTLFASAPVPEIALPMVASRPPVTFFNAKTVTGVIRVQPLLTPDPGSYQPKVLALIKSAKKTFYMQTQYIHTSDKAEDAPHMELIQAIVDLVNGNVDVKLITSEYQTKEWIEKLKDAGLDATNHLRIQAHVHNKGIVVDSKVVMVSSQNWSPEGTLRNRDAGMIIYNEEAAQYFEQIFLHDWAHLAAKKTAD
jgi:phosphatidylserine/phosphatidylglycerophosphate/cardiolipin synthase-like enzyme